MALLNAIAYKYVPIDKARTHAAIFALHKNIAYCAIMAIKWEPSNNENWIGNSGLFAKSYPIMKQTKLNGFYNLHAYHNGQFSLKAAFPKSMVKYRKYM